MLILASSSPRRRELLTQAAIPFQVHTLPIDESHRKGESPSEFTQRLAREKAQIVVDARKKAHLDAPDDVVLGADTIVVCDGEILGKPIDNKDAARMLRLIAERDHQVITGIALITKDGIETRAETTVVTVDTITDEEIADYISSGEPLDKAGAYGIQGRAARWIPRIEGCYFNVVGLPLALVASLTAGNYSRK